MWYHMAVPTLIIGVAIALPNVLSYYGNTYFFGNPMRRDVSEVWDLDMHLRDERLTGAVWKTAGLDNIPDKV